MEAGKRGEIDNQFFGKLGIVLGEYSGRDINGLSGNNRKGAEGKSQHNQAGILQEDGDRAVRTQVKGEENVFFIVYCCVFRNFFWRSNKNEIKIKEVIK